jgi:Na+-translocating ferredoxin:NAD+ oxidoreductase RnfD subunit
MKKLHFIILLFALNTVAQETQMYHYQSRGRIYQNGLKLQPDTIRSRFANNPEILKIYNAGRTKKIVGNVLLWGGIGLFIGKTIDYYTPESYTKTVNYFGEKYYFTEYKISSNELFFVSGAMILAAIPIKIGFEKKIKKSVALMNEVAKNPKTTFNIESTQIIANRNGIGLAITF